jgi:hypothetical protein
MFRTATAISMVLACVGCFEGESCDRATYERGCDGDRAHTYCSDKTHTGRERLFPRVVRIECERGNVCVEDRDVVTCVADPAERCDVVDATRCVNGIRQKCWDVGPNSTSGVRYWNSLGMYCDGTEGMP